MVRRCPCADTRRTRVGQGLTSSSVAGNGDVVEFRSEKIDGVDAPVIAGLREGDHAVRLVEEMFVGGMARSRTAQNNVGVRPESVMTTARSKVDGYVDFLRERTGHWG